MFWGVEEKKNKIDGHKQIIIDVSIPMALRVLKSHAWAIRATNQGGHAMWNRENDYDLVPMFDQTAKTRTSTQLGKLSSDRADSDLLFIWNRLQTIDAVDPVIY